METNYLTVPRYSIKIEPSSRKYCQRDNDTGEFPAALSVENGNSVQLIQNRVGLSANHNDSEVPHSLPRFEDPQSTHIFNEGAIFVHSDDTDTGLHVSPLESTEHLNCELKQTKVSSGISIPIVDLSMDDVLDGIDMGDLVDPPGMSSVVTSSDKKILLQLEQCSESQIHGCTDTADYSEDFDL